MTEPVEPAGPAGSAEPAGADSGKSDRPSPFEPDRMNEVQWLADYVYGTISTLVAIAGLTFETNPEALTTAGVVVVGALAIWFAHTLARLVTTRSWQHLQLRRADVRAQLLGSWSIVAAALPAAIIFTLSGLRLFEVKTAFVVAEVVGVLALAVVGIGTAGGRERPVGRRILYVLGPGLGWGHDRPARAGGPSPLTRMGSSDRGRLGVDAAWDPNRRGPAVCPPSPDRLSGERGG